MIRQRLTYTGRWLRPRPPQSTAECSPPRVVLGQSFGLPHSPTRTIFLTATPASMICEPVRSEFWRPHGKFSFWVPDEVVEVENLYDNSRRHSVFADLRHATLDSNENFTFHFVFDLLQRSVRCAAPAPPWSRKSKSMDVTSERRPIRTQSNCG